MPTPYIPEDRFPIQVSPGVQILGNYYFNLMLITGKKKSLLFEAGVSGMVDQVIRQLDELGISPDIIVVSHPRADHVTWACQVWLTDSKTPVSFQKPGYWLSGPGNLTHLCNDLTRRRCSRRRDCKFAHFFNGQKHIAGKN